MVTILECWLTISEIANLSTFKDKYQTLEEENNEANSARNELAREACGPVA